MSALKFSCPKCGQHLEGDESFCGQTIECPACQTQITAPSAPEQADSPPAPRTSQPPTPPVTSRPKTKSNKAGIVIALVIGIAIGYGVRVTQNQAPTPPSSAQATAQLPASPAPYTPEAAVAEKQVARAPAARPRRISREEWWAKLEENDLKFPGNRSVLDVKTEDFIRIMGKPVKTQSVGENMYWYYNCSDGQIQMVIKGWILESYGKIMAETINEF